MAERELSLGEMVRAGIEKIAAKSQDTLARSQNPMNPILAEERITKSQGIPIQTFDPADAPEIPDNELLQEAEAVATQLMTGQVPEDVQRQINRITAEMSVQGGVGPSQFASNVTAEALGLTSVDLQQQGANLAVNVASGQTAVEALQLESELRTRQLNMEGQMFDQEMNLKWATLQEQGHEWDGRMDIALQEIEQNWKRIDLQGLEIIRGSMEGMNRIMADLIINDSRQEIPDLQGNLDSISQGGLDFQQFVHDTLELGG